MDQNTFIKENSGEATSSSKHDADHASAFNHSDDGSECEFDKY